MGNDNLFHKKKARKANELTRTRQKRTQQVRILIACEDSKSSAYYFEEMAHSYDLKAVTVKGKECGSAPISVVNFAITQYEEAEKDGDPYDRVYCVFDRDQHESFALACQKIISKRQLGEPFFAITSTPCFELWLLLHFDYTDKPYIKSGTQSSCDQAHSALKIKQPDYGKATRGTYEKFSDKTDDAIRHAKSLLAHNQNNGSNNPTTNIHELVECLKYHSTLSKA
jgi:hypothetical protein